MCNTAERHKAVHGHCGFSSEFSRHEHRNPFGAHVRSIASETLSKMPRLSNDNRNRILGLLDAGVSQAEAARRYNVARSTIVRLVRRVAVTGNVADRPRTGQPRVTTRRQDVYIRQRHLRERFLNAQQTASIVIGNRGVPIHRRTVSRRLRERHIRCHRAYCGQILTGRHRHSRRDWIRTHLGRTNWRHVVFSDESRFNLFHNDKRTRVYRRRGERFADNTVIEGDRFGGGSVMVWAAINHDFRSRLVVINGNLTARRYIDEILRPELVPLIRRRRNGLTFQQDNARPHSARVTQEFLRQERIDVLPWPSVSQDLNPIEHLWDELGRRLRGRQHAPGTRQQLEIALREEWDNIPRRTIRRLCLSMPSRLRECQRKGGGHSRY